MDMKRAEDKKIKAREGSQEASKETYVEKSPIRKIEHKIGLENLSRDKKILIITILASIALLSFAAWTENFGVLANVIIISTFLIAVPQFLVLYDKYRNLKEMEERFPVFLRDIIEALQSGVPLHKAIISTNKSDYGKLTPEVKKMTNQLTWGLPLDNVLDQFANRVASRKRLFTSIKIIRESYLSGGDVLSTLGTVADNANLLEESEKERSSLLNQYVILMYAISFIFIGIVVAINNIMVPIFKMSSTTGGGTELLVLSNPCNTCFGFMCSICSIYETTASLIFSADPSSIGAYYVSLFFFMSIIQSAFSGLVAGQIGESSVKAGVKHSLIMVSITFGTFYFLIYLGLLGV
jgi:flagellar protein FlaJ